MPTAPVIYLPNLFEISRRFPLKINPNYQHIWKETREWILKCAGRFREQYAKQDLELFCVYCFPYINAVQLRISCDLTNLFFLIDDHCEEDEASAKKIFKMVAEIIKNIDCQTDSEIGFATQE